MHIHTHICMHMYISTIRNKSVHNVVTNTETLPVFFLLIRDLPMGAFISNTSNITTTACTGEEVSRTQTTAATSDVVSAQVGMRNNKVGSSQTLQDDPIALDFKFDTVANGSLYRCVYWNFSEP